MTQDIARPEQTPIAETRSAVMDLVRGFQDFQTRVETRLKTAEDRLALVDRKAQARPALGRADTAPSQRKAMLAFLRSGDTAGFDAAGLERKSTPDGGVIADPDTAERVDRLRRRPGALRAVANVVQVEGGSFDMLVERSTIGTAWVGETGTLVETGTAEFERIAIPLHELSALPRASSRLIEDSAFDVEGWLVEAVAERFARAENAAFVNGTGVDMPTGFLRHPQVPYAAAVWGQIGYVATGNAGGLPADDPVNPLIDVVYALPARYRQNATFVMTSRTAGLLRKLKDVDGRFLWTEALSCGQPPLLLGYPVLTCEEMPEIANDAAAIAFGDFRAGYTIAEKPDLRILRDPYTVKPHVQFFASLRVGGDVTDFAAIRLVKFAAA